MYVNRNPNPYGARVGDCVVRAVAIATDETWEKAYIDICIEGFMMGDMPSSNPVWASYLRSKGFTRHELPNTCPNCYTVRDFCNDFPRGIFIAATGSHVVCVMDGDYYDAWDSGDEIVTYFFSKEV